MFIYVCAFVCMRVHCPAWVLGSMPSGLPGWLLVGGQFHPLLWPLGTPLALGSPPWASGQVLALAVGSGPVSLGGQALSPVRGGAPEDVDLAISLHWEAVSRVLARHGGFPGSLLQQS